ncbi:MAG: hypothetical protein WC570_04125 [Patescibacteria group bacterium]
MINIETFGQTPSAPDREESKCERVKYGQPIDEKKLLEWDAGDFFDELYDCYKEGKTLNSRLFYREQLVNDLFHLSNTMYAADKLGIFDQFIALIQDHDNDIMAVEKKLQKEVKGFEAWQLLKPIFAAGCIVCTEKAIDNNNVYYYSEWEYIERDVYDKSSPRHFLTKELIDRLYCLIKAGNYNSLSDKEKEQLNSTIDKYGHDNIADRIKSKNIDSNKLNYILQKLMNGVDLNEK